jgi:hypothetical protein
MGASELATETGKSHDQEVQIINPQPLTKVRAKGL